MEFSHLKKIKHGILFLFQAYVNYFSECLEWEYGARGIVVQVMTWFLWGYFVRGWGAGGGKEKRAGVEQFY